MKPGRSQSGATEPIRCVPSRERTLRNSESFSLFRNRCLCPPSCCRVLADNVMAPTPAGALERAEREVAGRYEAKLREIESSMHQLISQNRALKAEVQHWTSSEPGKAQPTNLSTSASIDNGRRTAWSSMEGMSMRRSEDGGGDQYRWRDQSFGVDPDDLENQTRGRLGEAGNSRACARAKLEVSTCENRKRWGVPHLLRFLPTL